MTFPKTIADLKIKWRFNPKNYKGYYQTEKRFLKSNKNYKIKPGTYTFIFGLISFNVRVQDTIWSTNNETLSSLIDQIEYVLYDLNFNGFKIKSYKLNNFELIGKNIFRIHVVNNL